MSQQAMNLTFGDLMIIEIALVQYATALDLSMQSGQYISELIGKVEYNLAQLKHAAESQLAPGLNPDGPGTQV